MSNFIITTELLKTLNETQSLSLIKRKQRNIENYNYYITPNLSFELFNPKVMFITPKFIVFEYKKHEILNLFALLKLTNEMIKNKLKNYTRLDLKNVYDLYSVTDDTLTIRCSLPQKNNKYLIKNIDMYTNETRVFTLPRKGILLNSVIIDIRNIWEIDDKIGFNLELKLTKN